MAGQDERIRFNLNIGPTYAITGSAYLTGDDILVAYLGDKHEEILREIAKKFRIMKAEIRFEVEPLRPDIQPFAVE